MSYASTGRTRKKPLPLVRRGEALALRISDVDLVEDTLTISRSLDLKGTDKNVRVTKTENGERWLDIFEPLHIFQKQGLSEVLERNDKF